MANPHAIPITLSDADRGQLQGWVRRRKTGQGVSTAQEIGGAAPAAGCRARRRAGRRGYQPVDEIGLA